MLFVVVVVVVVFVVVEHRLPFQYHEATYTYTLQSCYILF
jgi:hypothetical protein